MKIREPNISEFKEVVSVINSEVHFFQETLSREEMSELCIGEETVESLKEGLEGRKYLVADLNEKIVGFISWSIWPNKIAWVSMLEVLPDYARRGIGTALLTYVENEAKSLGLVGVLAESEKKNVWVKKFNESLNYKILSPDDVSHGAFKDWIEEKAFLPCVYIWGKLL